MRGCRSANRGFHVVVNLIKIAIFPLLFLLFREKKIVYKINKTSKSPTHPQFKLLVCLKYYIAFASTWKIIIAFREFSSSLLTWWKKVEASPCRMLKRRAKYRKNYIKRKKAKNCILLFFQQTFIAFKKHIKLSRDAVFTTCFSH